MTTDDAPPVTDLRYTSVDSPVGALTVVGGSTSDGFALTGIYFPAHVHAPSPERLGRRADSGAADFDAIRRQLAEYFAGDRTVFDLTLAPAGPPFRQRVWALLRNIPYGSTRSYGDLAAELGDVRLARAVGTANARNPLSIVVPCHRVVGAAGTLTGYAGGLERKAFLLAWERRADALF
ncbi:methylated-DNA--[protein]-cysteine S-methyltransferase [Nakamurella deserti]|uniref:methylated-DNA--[protein]-cysteine S-methyltransferase n=1 Tax=Nakamurella deserti TaxID=2164074 RepID=UPI000DBE3F05|nr:methylated-DNA--[protein]-cysteine S-methyltransferase [Nakamurella deserti]